MQGLLQCANGDFDLAISSYRRLTEINPNNYFAWNRLGAILSNSSKHDESLEPLLRALKIKPKYTRALANLSICYFHKKLYVQSARLCLMVLKSNSKNSLNLSLLQKIINIIDDKALKSISSQIKLPVDVSLFDNSIISINPNSLEVLCIRKILQTKDIYPYQLDTLPQTLKEKILNFV